MKIYFSLLLAFVLISCKSDDLINLRVAKDRVKDYYESGKYDEEMDSIFSDAKDQIKNIKIKNNSTVIFDVDDTALSNYEISKKLDFGYDYTIVQDWVMGAKLPAIKQTKDFYDFLKSKNIKRIFLTSRNFDEYVATYKNLIDKGYNDFDTLIVRSKSDKDLGSQNFKTKERENLTKAGYEIIATVGDQWTDLNGGFSGIKIKVPNYLYEIK